MKYRIVKKAEYYFIVQIKRWIWRDDKYHFRTIEQAEYRLKELEQEELMDCGIKHSVK